MDRKLSKEELIELVEKICNACGDEEQIDNWIEIIEKETGCPEVTDYIYWEKENLSSEEIVDKALSYKPILL